MCFCGNSLDYSACCGVYHAGEKFAEDALTLMKSRYTAYVKANADYILKTTHPQKVRLHKRADILSWTKSNKWLKLEIIYADEQTVEFKAHYFNSKMQLEIHHERSFFEKINDKWYYLDAVFF